MPQTRDQRRGYILIATCLGLVFLLGVSGLAIDIGRMYITKSEAQSFVDSASLNAAVQLDGTGVGITTAKAAVNANPKKWQFQNDSFTGVTKFGTTPTGPWVDTPIPPTGYTFAQVQTTVNLPMYLMGALAGNTSAIGASAVAGQAITTSLRGFPYSPYTRVASPDNAADPYGFKIGNLYTILWGAPGNNTTCGTDATQPSLSINGNVRGYCCNLGGASSLRQTIVSGQTDMITPSTGMSVPMVTGQKDNESAAVAMRVDMDSDKTSTTYAQYRSSGMGNGERIVVLPVNNGPPNYTAIGFAGFFLLNDAAYSGLNGNQAACAEYFGKFVQGQQARLPAPGGSGAYHLKLYQ
jgi:Flp pilus assembly protein TadG